MSVYVVNSSHIDFLLYSAQRYAIANRSNGFTWYHDGEHKTLTTINEKEIGQMLLDENVKSWNANYNETEDYEFSYKRGHLPWPVAVQVLKSIKCYEYQTVESPDWEYSSAKAFMDRLRHDTIAMLDGWSEAEWGSPAEAVPMIARKKEEPTAAKVLVKAKDVLMFDF